MALACMPAAASAWTVTVHVHGAGAVDETTARDLMNCTVSPDGKSETTVTDCVAGTPAGLYASFDVINLRASVPQAAFDRGWRFLKWVDSSAGGGQINCDPQEDAGDHFSFDCQFQIFENLQTNLYFDDIAGPDDTSISGGPGDPTNQTTATFGFNAPSDPDSSYECRLDRPGLLGSYVACGNSTTDKSESYSGLTTNGTYDFYVRGKDPSGNVDATPPKSSWTVDTVAPIPSITGGPANPTNATSASFTISTDSGSLACKLDRPGIPGVFEACAPGARNYAGLGNGAHTFTLRATDAAGNMAFAVRGWTVDTQPPVLTLTGGPAQGSSTEQTSATFTIGTNEGTLTCTHDGSPEPCSAPTETLAGLAPGPHSFGISATDAAGNTSSDSRTWTVVAPAAPPPLPGPAADTTAPFLSYFKAAVHRIKNLRALKFLASCNEGCTLKAVAKLGKKTLGSKTLQLQAGFPTQVKIKLSRRGLSALRARLRTVRAVMVTIQFTLTDPAGNAAPATKKVKVRR